MNPLSIKAEDCRRLGYTALAAVAIAMGGLTAQSQSAHVMYVTGDTFISAANPAADNGASQKMISRENGTGGAAQYALLYFNIPTQVLEGYADAWDAAGGNAFNQLKAVLQVNNIGRGSANLRYHKAVRNWYGANGEATSWDDWQAGAGPAGLLGETGNHIASQPYFDAQVRGNETGISQLGVMNGSGNAHGLARTLLDWAASAGVGPSTSYGNTNVKPNYGLVVVPNPNSVTIELTSKEYAAQHGARYAPKMILYREPTAQNILRVTNTATKWDVYQSPTMTPTDGVGGTAPHYPTVLLPANDGIGKKWHESGYDMSGAGWNDEPDTLYNNDANATFVNNGGLYGWSTANSGNVQTILDRDFKGTPDGGGDATPREDGGVGNRLSYLYRTEFDAPNAANVDIMRMRMRYDGGARIYLNGVEVADVNFDDEYYRTVDGTWEVPFENENDMTFHSQSNGRASGETIEVYLDDPAFAGLLKESGNTLAVFSVNRNAFDFNNYFWGMDYVDLLSNTDIAGVPEPTSIALMSLAGIGLVAFRLRSRRATKGK